MHESRGISCVMWKDKCPVLLLSTHATLIGYPCMPIDEVPRRNGAIREQVPTSPVLQEYTKFMRGVDVANQLQALYSSLSRSHKWWHRVFLAMLDVTEVNMYIMYLDQCARRPHPLWHPMTHIQFKNALCDALLQGWPRWNDVENALLTHRLSTSTCLLIQH
jgi:hypothetical protein